MGVEHKFSDQIKLSALYLTTDDAANPASRNGLFNRAYSAGIQLDYSPTEELDLAFTYFHSYQPGGDVNISGSAGSQFARKPFVSLAADPPADTSADRFGLAASWRVNERVNIGGWFGLASANLLPDFQGAPDNPSATVINWALHLAFPDLGREGNLGGIIFGMQPKITDSDTAQSPNPRVDNDSSFHIEALYRYQVFVFYVILEA